MSHSIATEIPNFVRCAASQLVRFILCCFAASHATAGVLSVRAEGPDWFKVLNGNSSWNIVLDGEIDADASVRVAEALKRIGNDGADVYLNSPGGNLLEGMRIGRLIRQAGASTRIGTLVADPARNFAGKVGVRPVAGFCHSACSLAFLGGVYRYVGNDDQYGVHRFSSNATPAAGDIDAAQIVSASVAAYIREMDVDPTLFSLMVERGSDSIRLVAGPELLRLNVANNGRRRAEWSIEVVEGGQYLRGLQETTFGRGKAVFLCEKGSVHYHSFYQAGVERAKSLVAGGWYHSLLVGGNSIALPGPIRPKAAGAEFSVEFGLTREQVTSIAASSSMGHAMQLARDAPTFVGYEIDIPASASRRVGTFLRNCVANAR